MAPPYFREKFGETSISMKMFSHHITMMPESVILISVDERLVSLCASNFYLTRLVTNAVWNLHQSAIPFIPQTTLALLTSSSGAFLLSCIREGGPSQTSLVCDLLKIKIDQFTECRKCFEAMKKRTLTKIIFITRPLIHPISILSNSQLSTGNGRTWLAPSFYHPWFSSTCACTSYVTCVAANNKTPSIPPSDPVTSLSVL